MIYDKKRYRGKDANGKWIEETGMEHITRRHILLDDPSKGFIRGWNQRVPPQTASKYVFQENVTDLANAKEIVRRANAKVFEAAKSDYSWSRGNIVMEVAFWPKKGNGDEVFLGTGYDAWNGWKQTPTITLILAADCREVITSHPGGP